MKKEHLNPLSVVFLFVIWSSIVAVFGYHMYKVVSGTQINIFKTKTLQEMVDGNS